MRLYQLVAFDSEQSGPGYLVGEHALGLPGVTCPECHQTWAMTGVEYPAVAVPPELARRLRPRATSWDEFVELRGNIRHLLPRGNPLPPPGTDFGPITVRIRHESDLPDFIFPVPWTLVLRSRAYEMLHGQGLHIGPAVPVRRNRGRDNYEGFVEIQIEPVISLAESAFEKDGQPQCRLCGRDTWKLKAIVVADPRPMGTHDLARPANFPTKLIASDRFKQAVKQLKLTNAAFRAVISKTDHETSNSAAAD